MSSELKDMDNKSNREKNSGLFGDLPIFVGLVWSLEYLKLEFENIYKLVYLCCGYCLMWKFRKDEESLQPSLPSPVKRNLSQIILLSSKTVKSFLLFSASVVYHGCLLLTWYYDIPENLQRVYFNSRYLLHKVRY